MAMDVLTQLALAGKLGPSGGIQLPDSATMQPPIPRMRPRPRMEMPGAAAEPAMDVRPDAMGAGITAPPVAAGPARKSLSGLSDLLTSAAMGASNVRQGTGPISTAIEAFAGARQYKTTAREKASIAAMEKEERDRKAKVEAEDRAIAADERTYGRTRDVKADERAAAKERRDEQAAKRADEKAVLDAAKAIKELTKDNDGLTRAEVLSVERLVNERSKSLGLNDPKFLNPEEIDAKLKQLDQYRADIEGRITEAGGGKKVEAPGGAFKPVPFTGDAVTSEDYIKRGLGGAKVPILPPEGAAPAPPAEAVAPPAVDGQTPAKPMSQAEFDALPVGTMFVNPADGRVMRKAQ